MKLTTRLLAALLTVASVPAAATADHGYTILGTKKAAPFDVYNDGQNTYIEAYKGLKIAGARLDNDSFVVAGVPISILAEFAGQRIAIVRNDVPTEFP